MNRSYITPWLLVVGVIFVIVPVFGQGTLTITVSTVKQAYSNGENIVIEGQVLNSGTPVPNVVVVFELRDSANNVKASGYMTTDQSGTFSRTIAATGAMAQGSYTVYVSTTAGNENASNSTSFQVVSEFPATHYLVMLMLLFSVPLIFYKVLTTRESSAER